jgi:hypothetical protein
MSSHIYTIAKVNWLKFSTGNSDSEFSHSLGQKQKFDAETKTAPKGG